MLYVVLARCELRSRSLFVYEILYGISFEFEFFFSPNEPNLPSSEYPEPLSNFEMTRTATRERSDGLDFLMAASILRRSLSITIHRSAHHFARRQKFTFHSLHKGGFGKQKTSSFCGRLDKVTTDIGKKNDVLLVHAESLASCSPPKASCAQKHSHCGDVHNLPCRSTGFIICGPPKSSTAAMGDWLG
jgi:hypothetical protein